VTGEPTTAAGRALVRRELWEWLPEAYQMSHARLWEVVEAIEAEARAAALADVTAAVDAEQARWLDHDMEWTDEEVGSILDRIRAAIKELENR